jgi:hypothetical protein
MAHATQVLQALQDQVGPHITVIAVSDTGARESKASSRAPLYPDRGLPQQRVSSITQRTP